MTVEPQDPAKSFAIEVVEALRSAGYESLFAGGCVRDEILGRTPKDYDVATNATPQQVRQVFSKRRSTIPVGEAFGVIMVCGPPSAGNIEVATFRRDMDYSDGRRPDAVEFTTAEQDAERRDFTINGLFYDPIENKVIDYVGGEEDIRRKVVRAIGDPAERFAEDKLRMLRAVRFAATLNFDLDSGTLSAIQTAPADILVVSAERIGMELRQMIADKNRREAVRLLRTSGLLEQLLPEAQSTFTDQSKFSRILSILESLGETEFSVAFAGLLQDWYSGQGDPATVAKICRRLKLTNQEQRSIDWILKNFSAIEHADERPWPVIQRLLIQPESSAALQLAFAIGSIDESPLRGAEFCKEKLKLPESELDPLPLIDGNDLQARGIKAGKIFKVILDEVRDAQLNGELHSAEQAWELVDSIAERDRA